jgi:hypothetical protein
VGERVTGGDKQVQPVGQARREEIRKLFGPSANWLIIAIFALALGFQSPLGILELDPGAGALVFQVAGTIVALALPAAELSNSLFRETEGYIIRAALKPSLATDRLVQVADENIQKLRDQLFPAWRGSVFALCAFVLSTLSLLLPRAQVRLSGEVYWLPKDFLVGAALGFLLVGAYWFFRTVYVVFRLKAADTTLERVRRMVAAQKLKAGQPAQPDSNPDGDEESEAV